MNALNNGNGPSDFLLFPQNDSLGTLQSLALQEAAYKSGFPISISIIPVDTPKIHYRQVDGRIYRHVEPSHYDPVTIETLSKSLKQGSHVAMVADERLNTFVSCMIGLKKKCPDFLQPRVLVVSDMLLDPLVGTARKNNLRSLWHGIPVDVVVPVAEQIEPKRLMPLVAAYLKFHHAQGSITNPPPEAVRNTVKESKTFNPLFIL